MSLALRQLNNQLFETEVFTLFTVYVFRDLLSICIHVHV